MINNKFIFPILGLALVSSVATASRDEYEEYEAYEHKRGPVPFEVLDLNRDGVVTAEEHVNIRAQRHQAFSKKGYPMRNMASAPTFEQIDKDASGAISREEMLQWRAERWQQKSMQRARRFE